MDRYWVGGRTGDWTVEASWADTPGGEPGASVPTVDDTAHFDRNVEVSRVPYDSSLWATIHVTGFWIAVRFYCYEPNAEMSPGKWQENIRDNTRLVIDQECTLTVAGKVEGRNATTDNVYSEIVTSTIPEVVFWGGWKEYEPVARLKVELVSNVEYPDEMSVRVDLAGSVGMLANVFWGDDEIDTVPLGIGNKFEKLEHTYSTYGEKTIGIQVDNLQGEWTSARVKFSLTAIPSEFGLCRCQAVKLSDVIYF